MGRFQSREARDEARNPKFETNPNAQKPESPFLLGVFEWRAF
jgi:hypothetical protein